VTARVTAAVTNGAMQSSSTTAGGGSRREATRQKLYEAAVTLIAEQGFSATTVDEIAERAGVAKGTVYYNFASKSVLFEELLRHGVGLLTASLREAAEHTARDGGSKVDALDAMIRAGAFLFLIHWSNSRTIRPVPARIEIVSSGLAVSQARYHEQAHGVLRYDGEMLTRTSIPCSRTLWTLVM